MTKMEKRAATELRAEGRKLTGYAATFNTETRIADFTETIRAGAFGDTLAAGRDILALVDHDTARVLARTKSGTLRLSEDERGLRFEIDVPDTTLGRDILTLAERRDLGGMSFGFSAVAENWAGDKRELRAVKLHEISIVQAFPAYPSTEVSARSLKPRSTAARRISLLEMEAR